MATDFKMNKFVSKCLERSEKIKATKGRVWVVIIRYRHDALKLSVSEASDCYSVFTF